MQISNSIALSYLMRSESIFHELRRRIISHHTYDSFSLFNKMDTAAKGYLTGDDFLKVINCCGARKTPRQHLVYLFSDLAKQGVDLRRELRVGKDGLANGDLKVGRDAFQRLWGVEQRRDPDFPEYVASRYRKPNVSAMLMRQIGDFWFLTICSRMVLDIFLRSTFAAFYYFLDI